MTQYNFKKITVVPRGQEIVDIVLSKLQRKTPTVVHRHYEIGRIRRFYCTKIKFAQQTFHDKITTIVTEFPRLNEMHPFFADLINVDVDKDHYKLALAELNGARQLIDRLAHKFVILMKYADSLYRCKRLKIAAVGSMCTIMRKKGNAMTWLEEVRQKLARMPLIDPNAPTIILCGCPNVGKSSFMNKVTKANVEVEPYAFTTTTLYLGHLEYETIRYQVIDTPGLLERPLEERNTIEMKSITAMAHLRACILFIIDVSDTFEFPIAQQLALFNDIKPLFVNKPVIVALNKTDVRKRSELSPEEQEILNAFEAENVPLMEMSTLQGDITDVKLKACNDLLKYRIDRKLNSSGISRVENRLHVAMPKKRDEKERPPCIPEAVMLAAEKRKLEREVELEMGDEYYLDLHKYYMLANPDEKNDIIPEIMDAMNVADFVDEDIEQRLEAILKEEEQREALGVYDSSSSEDEEEREIRIKAELVHEKKKLAIVLSKEKRRVKAPRVPRTATKIDTKKVESSFKNLGVEVEMDAETNFGRSRSKSVVRTEVRKRKREESNTSRTRSASRSRPPRDQSGVRDEVMAKKTKRLANISQRKLNLNARKGEADRRILTAKPKHLFAGKRKMGKNDRR